MKKKRGKEVYEYTVPDFDKEKVLKSVKKNLGCLEDIVAEMIKFLPELIKTVKEKD